MPDFDPTAGIRDAVGLMQTMALLNVYGQKDESRDAELALRQNEYRRKLAEDEVQTKLSLANTAKASEEADALVRKRDDLSLFGQLEAKRIQHMQDLDAPGLSGEEAAAYNVIGRSYNLIDKFHEPDPLTDAKIANLNAQTRRLDTYMQQTYGWVPTIQRELNATEALFKEEEAYSEKKASLHLPVLSGILDSMRESRSPKDRIADMEQQYRTAMATLDRETGAGQKIADALQDRIAAIQDYTQRTNSASARVDALITNTKIKPEDLDQQRTLIQQERDLYRELSRKAELEKNYLMAMGDDEKRKPIGEALRAVNAGLQKMGAVFTEGIKKSEDQRSALQLEKLDVQRDRLKLSQDQYEQSQAYQKNLVAAQAAFLEGDQSQKSLAKVARQYGVRADQVLGASKNPNAPATVIHLDQKTGEGLAKEIGPMMMASRDAASGAIETIDSVDRIKTAIDTGAVTLGPGATVRNTINQVAQLLGVGGKNAQEQLVNTREVIRGLAQFSLSARKALKGQGQISDFEGRLLLKAEAGEIGDMTLPELKRFVDVTERLARRQYDLHQQNLSKMRQHKDLADMAVFYDVPKIAPPGKVNTQEGSGEWAKSGWSIKPIQ